MPLLNILLKGFAWRFYKENSGLLLFFFVSIISYCFFIKTAGVYRQEESVFYHLMLMMTFITSPLVMLMVFTLWLLYTIKSWQFVARLLRQDENRFLFYSTTSYSWSTQFKAWLLMQLAISLPLIGYWIFASILGIIYHSWSIPFLTLLYIFLLALISAWLYVFLVNRAERSSRSSILIRLSKKHKKHFSTLFIYRIFDQEKLLYLLIKALSLLTMTALFRLFQDAAEQQIAPVIILGVTTIHSFFIFQEQYFQESRLHLLRNLPISREKLFFSFALVYFLITLPETLWLFSKFPVSLSLTSCIFGLCIAFLFRSIVLLTGMNVFKYLLLIFGLFVLLFYLILLLRPEFISFTCLTISFSIYYFRFYKPFF
ncbi:hypothetical protein DBR11_24045 [Pedobacter sp. HMWF019]|uniref:hypothetical protein n=1 Tax=Pedobacter sp. HMWF019 TaxID=2056856 RepID=UPI000D3D442F|nr:hypothetical protein [Pedobacter sp. HMWF019]PTS94104.1 hypothetical protein DBR11_24045 [Pedobacter sp. HMWF019]